MKLAVRKQTTELQTTLHKTAFGAYCNETAASFHYAAMESKEQKAIWGSQGDGFSTVMRFLCLRDI